MTQAGTRMCAVVGVWETSWRCPAFRTCPSSTLFLGVTSGNGALGHGLEPACLGHRLLEEGTEAGALPERHRG